MTQQLDYCFDDNINPLAAEFLCYPRIGTEIIFYKSSPGTDFHFQCLLFGMKVYIDFVDYCKAFHLVLLELPRFSSI